MLFTEARFLIFFAVVFCVYWLLKSPVKRKVWLLVLSYAFYAAWDWRFLSLIWISTLLDFFAGRALGRTLSPPRRRSWLLASLIGNLGLLCLFKYFNFFAESAVALLELFGFHASAPTLELILPVGISFYTFQTLSYTIDVYRGRLRPVESLLDLALFVGFFPQLVAGPIVRAADFLPQLLDKKRLGDVAFKAHLTLFLLGYIKKACMADNLAALVDPVFENPEIYGTSAKWLAACLYGVQIYCDFSGYSDMAIATAGLLGFELPLNFNFPYLASSVTRFWQRWHISLSTWFRDYLYIPMGGNRCARPRIYLNLVIVFFLCGLWHGAQWHFVIWGLYHGAFLVVERVLGLGRPSTGLHPLRRLYTLLVVITAWVFFRAGDLVTAGVFMKGLAGLNMGPGPLEPADPVGWAVLGLFVLVHILMYRGWIPRAIQSLPDWAFAPLFGAATALALSMAAAGYKPFIYFQF